LEAASLADELLERCRFPEPGGGPVALAVSGGADSLALLILAARRGLDAVAIHVDHGLRDGSAAEADVVRRAAATFGVGFQGCSVRVGAGPDLEARARAARYRALPTGVLTGHTMDDQAETVLLNVLRGAALDGLAAMGSGDGERSTVRRPLLGLRRRETEALCHHHGLDPVVDPSNSDRRFRRNRVRTEVLPLLCEVAERDVVPVLARQAELLEVDRSYLDQQAAALDPTDTRALRSAPPALVARALRGWLRSHVSADGEKHPPTQAELRRVLDVVAGRATACQLGGGRRVERHDGRLEVVVTGALDGAVPAQVVADQPGAGRVALR